MISQAVGTRGSDERVTAGNDRRAPLSESQRIDPRQFQLNQLRRRFSPEENEEREATALTFKLVPTDPDFPFEMTDLQCTLRVPQSYPTIGQPSLRVTNPEMDRGYQINVERGFDSLVTTRSTSTLLALVNELDKRLEGFLMSEKAQTIKLASNTGEKTSTPALRSTTAPAKLAAVSTTLKTSPFPSLSQHSAHQIAAAKAKRESDVRQLEARMGRQRLFTRSPEGLSFSMPLDVPNPSKLPFSLQSVRSVTLFVPLSYNLEPCAISFVDVSSSEAYAVQAAFERRARMHPDMTLMAHFNHLTQNMHVMATEASAPSPNITSSPPSPTNETVSQMLKDAIAHQSDHPSHVQVIPRPPEWDIALDDTVESGSSGTDGSENGFSEYETDRDEGGATLPPEARVAANAGPDLGIIMSFPSLELHGADLLDLYSISLTIKCDRCKQVKDVKNIRSHASDDHSLIKHESCNKCANELSIGQ